VDHPAKLVRKFPTRWGYRAPEVATTRGYVVTGAADTVATKAPGPGLSTPAGAASFTAGCRAMPLASEHEGSSLCLGLLFGVGDAVDF
jgi:hypothetical protein